MEITHRTRNLRIAPRKVRLVIDKIRHMPAEQAVQVLPLITKRAALPLQKSLKSAIQVAKDQKVDPKTLVIQRVWCDEGAAMKRVMSFSRGRTAPMMKKFSHVTFILKGEALAPTRRRSTVKKQETVEPTVAEAEQVSDKA